MNHPFRSALAVLALATSTVVLQAEPVLKIVTIDMEQVFEKYYKTETEQAKLRDAEKKAKEQLDAMVKDREALVTQAKELQEQSGNQVLSEDARKKAEADLQAKVGEIRAKESEIQGFAQQTQQLLQRRFAQFQQQAIEEISKVAKTIAEKKEATLVLNSGATAVVVHAHSGFSITDDVLAVINKDRPAPTINITTPTATPAK